MKTLNSFTKIQSQKFGCAQLVITVLNMHNIPNKIGGSFVNFVNSTKDDFHDIDIIVPEDYVDIARTHLKNYLKYTAKTPIYSNLKNKCVRLDFGNNIIIDILSDIMNEPKTQFMGITLENERIVNYARQLIKDTNVVDDVDF